jgi:hypothetical protein
LRNYRPYSPGIEGANNDGSSCVTRAIGCIWLVAMLAHVVDALHESFYAVPLTD